MDSKSINICCLSPKRRDALEESGRLALSFISKFCSPDFFDPNFKELITITLDTPALKDGCYLADSAQVMLEAVQAYGVKIGRRLPQNLSGQGDVATLNLKVDIPDEWREWWLKLPIVGDSTADLVIEIR